MFLVIAPDQASVRLQRLADRLCFFIVSTDMPLRQIQIERLNLRTEAARLFPDQLPLYDMIYESRFRRLTQQFRCTSS